jgi:hypothetical protein
MVVVEDNVQPQTQASPPLPLQQNVPEVPAAAPPQIMQLQILGHEIKNITKSYSEMAKKNAEMARTLLFNARMPSRCCPTVNGTRNVVKNWV